MTTDHTAEAPNLLINQMTRRAIALSLASDLDEPGLAGDVADDALRLVAALRVVEAFFAVERAEATVPGGCTHVPSGEYNAVMPRIAAILRGEAAR